jgi:hypothetical protein
MTERIRGNHTGGSIRGADERRAVLISPPVRERTIAECFFGSLSRDSDSIAGKSCLLGYMAFITSDDAAESRVNTIGNCFPVCQC